MKTISTTHLAIIFNSELKEVLDFTKKKDPAGKLLSEKPTNKNNIDNRGICANLRQVGALYVELNDLYFDNVGQIGHI